ncbi:hypothetical protein [Streptomyces prunicolor]|uniref:Uncharacterized protein n=1 Tax=Streptomyces prunicolor TaxID=67348 RepID=A0ABU4F880_9ACTN|nr:hypothetical protein [Streptomyces prunicolor]MDV7216798.1 hypothetical protein [Streptomyces prunicolor]
MPVRQRHSPSSPPTAEARAAPRAPPSPATTASPRSAARARAAARRQHPPTPDSGRPRLGLDTSEAEANRLEGICFGRPHGHGVPSGHKPSAGNTWLPRVSPDKHPAAVKACLSKKPLQPPEEDPAKNPHYADGFRAYIKCLNDGGLKAHALPDNAGWTFDGSAPTMSESAENNLERNCALEAFSAKQPHN